MSACASRWLTATSGSPCTSAMALAVVTPTSRPPIRPGPAVTATASRSGEADAGFAHGLGDDLVQALDVGARGDLRHHAAVAAVLLPLRPHHVGEDAAAAVGAARHHGGRRLVAARLDAEHERLARICRGCHGAVVCTWAASGA